MLLLCSAVITMVLIMTSISGLAQTRPPVALEHQEMVAKRAKEREKIEDCQRQATEEKILPRDRPQFVVKCLDGRVRQNPVRSSGMRGQNVLCPTGLPEDIDWRLCRLPGAFKVICLAIALMFLAGRGRGDRMKSGSTFVSRLTNVQPAG